VAQRSQNGEPPRQQLTSSKRAREQFLLARAAPRSVVWLVSAEQSFWCSGVVLSCAAIRAADALPVAQRSWVAKVLTSR
jgi:hypothetical protein